MPRNVKPAYRFETYKREDGDIGLRIVARNGQIVLSGEGYKRKQSIVKMLDGLFGFMEYEMYTGGFRQLINSQEK